MRDLFGSKLKHHIDPNNPKNSLSSVKIDESLAVIGRYDSRFCFQFLKKLTQAKIKPKLLIIEVTPLRKRLTMFQSLCKRIGFFEATRHSVNFWLPIFLRRLSGGRLYSLPNFTNLSERCMLVENVNSASVVDAIKQEHITKIMLAQSGLIRQPLLDLDYLWIVNAHPAILPACRGVDVIRWSLLENYPLGVTLHEVDAGVDTGPILKQEFFPPQAGETYAQLEARLIECSLDILVEAAIKGRDAYPIKTPNPAQVGKQYYLMPFALRKRLAKKIT